MKSFDIRDKFLAYFKARDHAIVPSDSLIPSGDPSLLFTSAGMVPFKPYFLGLKKGLKRAASSQRCFRTSDIDRVGHTARHLTFFEMLGNFSFGDYFKQDAIAWAWEFLTQEIKLPSEKLILTVYKEDEEAFGLWKKFVPESRIIRMGEDTNFWNMGPTGPCGPCSEILMDLGPSKSCGKPTCGPACDCDRYLEIWNLVFTQFDRQSDGALKPLPSKNIDTGMGLERLVTVANGLDSNFQTDLFKPLIAWTQELMGKPYPSDPKTTAAYHVIADHARALTFLTADGILPSNEGRGYVLRRILRRAARSAALLGYKKPFLYKLCGEVVGMYQKTFPSLSQAREHIAALVKLEEEKFLETLETGLARLETLFQGHARGGVIPGQEVFKLYDTYGFPVDLTREIAQEKNLKIDEEGFQAAQQEAAKISAQWKGSGQKDTALYHALQKKAGVSVFRGYEVLELKTQVTAILKGGKETETLNAGEEGEIFLKETPFYAESGGQLGDCGVFESSSAKVQIQDTQAPVEGLISHLAKVVQGTIRVGDTVTARVDALRRAGLRRHHTATHLLHAALRKVLGTHVTQSGSLVASDRLRFDFTHPGALKKEDLKRVEDLVNEAVVRNIAVQTVVTSQQEARQAGALAFFGDKYGDKVRCVMVSDLGWGKDKDPVSMEFCGGTHVSATGEIGPVKVTQESSVASGVRRIEAVAGEEAMAYMRRLEDNLNDIAEKLKCSPTDIPARLGKILERQKELESEIEKLKGKLISGQKEDYLSKVQRVGDVQVLALSLEDVDEKSLRQLSDRLKEQLKSGIVILAGKSPEKVSFVASVTKDLEKSGYHAGSIAKKLAAALSGSGGGRADFAQGGSRDTSRLNDILKNIAEYIH